MEKFAKGERVIFRTEDGSKQRGKVTAVLPKLRSIKTDSGHIMKVPVRRLKKSPDRVLILEGRLDRTLRSNRIYGDMLKTWLSAYGVEALYERVHTTEDMRRFLSREGRDIATRYIHIICHGEDLSGCGTAKLCLTFDKLDLFKNCNVFENLTGKILIFSCCEIGNDIKAMEEVKRVSQRLP